MIRRNGAAENLPPRHTTDERVKKKKWRRNIACAGRLITINDGIRSWCRLSNGLAGRCTKKVKHKIKQVNNRWRKSGRTHDEFRIRGVIGLTNKPGKIDARKLKPNDLRLRPCSVCGSNYWLIVCRGYGARCCGRNTDGDLCQNGLATFATSEFSKTAAKNTRSHFPSNPSHCVFRSCGEYEPTTFSPKLSLVLSLCLRALVLLLTPKGIDTLVQVQHILRKSRILNLLCHSPRHEAKQCSHSSARKGEI